ncbi:MAG: ABC transporter permease, partial [Bryobacteraceae bacterium]
TSSVAILSLAIGLGASATVFSFVNALLLRPLPVPKSDRLIEIWHHRIKAQNAFMPYLTLSYPDFAYYRDHNSAFSEVAGFVPEAQKVSWVHNSEAQDLRAHVVSENFFGVAGFRPVLGRFFTNKGEDPSVVISASLWQRLGGEPSLVGSVWNLNGHALRILGVAPTGASSILGGMGVDVWVPMRDAGQIGFHMDPTERHIHWLIGLARLKGGESSKTAQANIHFLGNQLAAAYPDTNRDTTGATFQATLTPGPVRKLVALFAALLMVVMILVLLIGCANAANVLLARASSRSRELAVRSALGASRKRLMWQTFHESILLAILSGAVAYGLAAFAAPMVLTLRPATLPLEIDVNPDWRVALFVFGISVVTGFICGMLPAFRGTKVDVVETMKAGGHGAVQGRSRTRSALVIAQVSICMVLLVAGSLCLRSLQGARTIKPGFDPDGVFVASVELRPNEYSDAAGLQFFRTAMDRVASLPGVRSVSLTDHLPLGQIEMGVIVDVPGVNAPKGLPGWPISVATVAPGYFHTLGTHLLAGRDFTWADTLKSQPVVVINEAMARQMWKGENAIGKQLTIKERGSARVVHVAGIVETGKYKTLGEEPTPFLYQPIQQSYIGHAVFVVRTVGNPLAFTREFRTVIRQLNPRLALFETGSMRQSLEFATFTMRLSGVLFGIAGILALVLAFSGLYGVVAYAVAQRAHEIGIRMALGAGRAAVLKTVMRHSLALIGTGIVIGSCLALAATRALSSVLLEVSATDALTFVAVAIGLLGTGLLATYLPARAAMVVDPVQALKYD